MRQTERQEQRQAERAVVYEEIGACLDISQKWHGPGKEASESDGAARERGGGAVEGVEGCGYGSWRREEDGR